MSQDESITDRYAHGECHTFTQAVLAAHPGWIPLYLTDEDGLILHSVVVRQLPETANPRRSKRLALDAYGWEPLSTKADRYSDVDDWHKTSKSSLRKNYGAKGLADAAWAVKYVLGQARTEVVSRGSTEKLEKARLETWYRRLGFTSNLGRKRDYKYSGTMIRRPTPRSRQ